MALQRLQRDATSGLPTPPERLNVGFFCIDWLARVTPRLRDSTRIRPQVGAIWRLTSWSVCWRTEPVRGAAIALKGLSSPPESSGPPQIGHFRCRCELPTSPWRQFDSRTSGFPDGGAGWLAALEGLGTTVFDEDNLPTGPEPEPIRGNRTWGTRPYWSGEPRNVLAGPATPWRDGCGKRPAEPL